MDVLVMDVIIDLYVIDVNIDAVIVIVVIVIAIVIIMNGVYFFNKIASNKFLMTFNELIKVEDLN